MTAPDSLRRALKLAAPEPSHDVDLVVAEADADRAAEVLAAAGFEIDRPPEDWIVKASSDGVEDGLIARALERDVLGVRIPVQSAQDVVLVKLLSLAEHYCDFGALLPVVRAVREQLDWDR